MTSKFWTWVAARLPRPLVYFATVRLWANATGSKHGLPVSAVTVGEALDRWEED